MSTNDHPDQETERTPLRVRHRELQPQVGRRGDLSSHRLRRCCVARLHPHQERDLFRATNVNRPETSSSPWHDVSTNVAYGQSQVCSARGLAASPAIGEGTTRDHFAREATAVITSAKGDTEAAARPTPEHDGTRDRRLPVRPDTTGRRGGHRSMRSGGVDRMRGALRANGQGCLCAELGPRLRRAGSGPAHRPADGRGAIHIRADQYRLP